MIRWQEIDKATYWAMVVVTIGILLRIALALVNLESNDDHLIVSRVIAQENRLPTRDEMMIAYHPKLWHISVAVVWRILPDDLSVGWQTKAAQLMNAIAGAGVVILSSLFILRQSWLTLVKLIVLAMVSFNTRLISISAQATNDSWAIFFGTAAAFFVSLFLETRQQRHFYTGLIFIVLMALTKGSGLVMFASLIFTLLALVLWWGRKRDISWSRAVFFVLSAIIVFSFVVIPLTPYWGDWMASRGFVPSYPETRPLWREETYGYLPGVTSVLNSFFTFRLVGLLKDPMITLGNEGYPLHRTSLWSQLYGRFNFVHFERWPPSWELDTHLVRTLGRTSFIFGLWPLSIFLFGILYTGQQVVSKMIRRRELATNRLFMLACTVAFLLFAVLFSYKYRPYYAMKMIYVLPAVLAGLYLFGESLDLFYRKTLKNLYWQDISNIFFLILFIVYLTDMSVLLNQLAK